MKIAFLLEREPFPRILEQTFERHLEATRGGPHHVSWQWRLAPRGRCARETHGLWYCNPQINAIFSARARLGVFGTPWREYVHGRTWLRTLGRAAYLGLVTLPHLRVALARHALSIEPELPDAEWTLILGGNTRLRLLNTRAERVVVILKDEFARTPLEDELALRGKFAWLPAPRIARVLEGGLAYEETLLHGTAVAQLFDRRRAEEALGWALTVVERLTAESSRATPLEEWIACERSRCVKAARLLAPRDPRGLLLAVQPWLDEVRRSLEARRSRLPQEVAIAWSHGDLSSGNVLVGRERNWLIDWERAGRRAAGYDLLTLALDSHTRVRELRARGERLAAGEVPGTALEELAQASLWRLAEHSRDQLWLLVQLFLLGELRFHLEENTLGPFFALSPALVEVLAQLRVDTR